MEGLLKLLNLTAFTTLAAIKLIRHLSKIEDDFIEKEQKKLVGKSLQCK